MSGMGGFGVLRWLAAHQELKRDLDVIVLSGIMSPKEIEVAYELGALVYLTKSASSTELCELTGYLKEACLTEPKPEIPSLPPA